MSFTNSGYSFTEAKIKAVAPTGSGVYGLYTSQRWVYIGETKNIEQRLLQHLAGDNACISGWNPTGFAYESVTADERVARQDALILELNPACNQKLG
jgi:predicted GIY-YIG superfamily endonuclease